MSNRPISVLRYQDAWPLQFQELSTWYKLAFGKYIIDIHHVGSTSVPGLAAKPRIDIDIEIDFNFFGIIKENLNKLGYSFQGDLGIIDRYAFKYIGTEIKPAHNLYVCPSDSMELKRHLAFRNYLRNHKDACEIYSRIKWDAIRLGKNRIQEYMDHKGKVVGEILVKALHWAGLITNVTIFCPSCDSKTVGEFRIRYIVDGGKSEYYNFECVTCQNSWEEKIS